MKKVNWWLETDIYDRESEFLTQFTIDICESQGELYVLEIGSFSCAGEYGCDLSAIVEFGAKAAWEDYQAVNEF